MEDPFDKMIRECWISDSQEEILRQLIPCESQSKDNAGGDFPHSSGQIPEASTGIVICSVPGGEVSASGERRNLVKGLAIEASNDTQNLSLDVRSERKSEVSKGKSPIGEKDLRFSKRKDPMVNDLRFSKSSLTQKVGSPGLVRTRDFNDQNATGISSNLARKVSLGGCSDLGFSGKNAKETSISKGKSTGDLAVINVTKDLIPKTSNRGMEFGKGNSNVVESGDSTKDLLQNPTDELPGLNKGKSKPRRVGDTVHAMCQEMRSKLSSKQIEQLDDFTNYVLSKSSDSTSSDAIKKTPERLFGLPPSRWQMASSDTSASLSSSFVGLITSLSKGTDHSIGDEYILDVAIWAGYEFPIPSWRRRPEGNS